MKKHLFLIPIICMCIIGFICTGNDEPAITITAVDCPKDSIILTLSATKRGNAPNFFTDVVLSVKCGTRPIRNAEVKAETNWGTFKWTTDAQGEIRRNSGPRAGDPSGSKVTITIEGSDGSKTTSQTIQ